MKNRYFLMRHGESEANLADLIISDPATGCVSYGLSPLGREQARASATTSGLGPDTVVVCSDFLRTRQTAEVACLALGCSPASCDARLRERFFGDREGQSAGNYEATWDLDDRDASHATAGVEPAELLAARLSAVIADLELVHSGSDILLVSHGDPLRFLHLHQGGRPLTEHRRVRFFAPAEIRALAQMPES